VGDIIHIKIGDKVPADARLFWCQGNPMFSRTHLMDDHQTNPSLSADLKLEMSSLTGEPNAISRSVIASEERDIDASNLVFNTAQCMEGEGYGIVYATGDHTFIGRIASLASETKEAPTPMQREVLIFVSRLSVVALTMAIVFFLIGWGRQSFNKSAWIPAFVNGFVVIAVACVPEGLPVTVVSCLSIASARMAEQDCYVKQLSSVETLGSVSLICSDKTGTLTMNKMAVANFFFDLYRHSGAAMLETLPPSSMRSEPKMPTFAYMETIMGVCNRERFVDQRELTEMQVDQMEAISAIKPGQTMNTMRAKLSMALKDDSKRESLGGDPSERAMFQYVASRQSIELMRYKHAIELEVPFNSKNKFSLSVASFIDPSTKQPRKVLMMKGAPERVLARCKSFMLRGESVPIDDEFRQKYDDAYNTYGNDGERVLGFAVLELDLNAPKLTSETWPQSGYTFLGLVTLRDPPKPSVPPAIAIVRKAGIRVFMVTGDHHLTGAAIARQVGIISQEAITNHDIVEQYHCTMDDAFESHLHEFDAVVVTGAELESFTEERWDAVLSKKEVVFARTSPEQKLQIVTHAQKLGNIVAVTGDGVYVLSLCV
jgi:magnesium-transporting ATPase (P-type)